MYRLKQFLRIEYTYKVVYPDIKDIFQLFNLTPIDNIKVVIVGQDPYHNKNQAHGLSFSVVNSSVIPPSLYNIFKELQNDLNIQISPGLISLFL